MHTLKVIWFYLLSLISALLCALFMFAAVHFAMQLTIGSIAAAFAMIVAMALSLVSAWGYFEAAKRGSMS